MLGKNGCSMSGTYDGTTLAEVEEVAVGGGFRSDEVEEPD